MAADAKQPALPPALAMGNDGVAGVVPGSNARLEAHRYGDFFRQERPVAHPPLV